ITIFGDAKARSGIKSSYIEAAAAKWNDVCQQSSRMPHLRIDWETDRTLAGNYQDPDRPYHATILITFLPDVEPSVDRQLGKMAEPARWFDDNRIQILGKCNRSINIPCEKIRPLISWEPPWGSM